jgi:hypothetical protein
MLKNFIILLLLTPLCSTAQVIPGAMEADPAQSAINKDVARVLLSLATDTKASFTINYERAIVKPITLFLKAGPGVDRQFDSTDIYGQKQYSWVINAMASAELRFYIGLSKRAKQNKKVANFSGLYLSTELLAKSGALIRISNPNSDRTTGFVRPYINIGYQKQVKTTYYGIFFGTRFPGRVYGDAVSGLDLLHAGISAGIVL